MIRKLKKILTVAAATLAAAGSVHAQSGSFSCITNNSVDSCGQAESTLSWAWDGSIFSISNSAGGGYVAEIYFDLVVPAMSVSWLDGTGTSFSAGASPRHLAGGTEVNFTSDFAFDSDSAARGRPIWGIDAGETTRFAIAGASLDSFSSGQISAGLHVRRLVYGESESLTVSPIPEPSTYALMLAGLGIVGWVTHRRRRAEAATV